MKNVFLFILSVIGLYACKSYPEGAIALDAAVAVDYSDLKYWAAHPDKSDMADKVPGGGVLDNDPLQQVDVFFIHPTTYTQYKGDLSWNADINDVELNELTDETTILNQASAFNQAGRVYAPRYRQAHLEAFYTDDRIVGEKSLDFAYEDVKASFRYYMKHENNGRPIIIAAHSQGTRHAKVLLAEYFDGTELLDQLVAAYVLGIPVLKDQYGKIPPCQSEDDLHCFLSWRTFKKGYIPENLPTGDNIAVINPLSWENNESLIGKEENKGGLLRDFEKLYPQLSDAQIHDGLLWASKPKFPFSFLFTRKNYHILDVNMFYVNVRENAQHRAEVYTTQEDAQLSKP